jgi:hypothetical protein
MAITIDRKYLHKPEQIPPMIEKILNELKKYYKNIKV